MVTPTPALPLRVNGVPAEAQPGETVLALLQRLGLHREGVAVAVNMQVVPRGQHASRQLEAGDRVEVIQAVGGG